MQRITTSINKHHTLYNSCVSELKMVFRQHDDHGPTRTRNTPESEALLSHIENFASKWKHICEKDGNDENLFREEFENRLKNLKDHIKNGCLSEIPPGYSTSINESLHEKLNRLFAGAKMGPELAVALLTIFFLFLEFKKEEQNPKYTFCSSSLKKTLC